MNFKKSQSGRSMVEMLGVLAIIGVLSVGGIAGYSLSMRRHRANGVIDLASKYALIVYSNCQQMLLNGEVTSLSKCSIRPYDGYKQVTSFDDAGIGSMPAGSGTGFHSLTIDSNENTGVDTVSFTLDFSDPKICQAVASIMGTNCFHNNQYVRFSFKQN